MRWAVAFMPVLKTPPASRSTSAAFSPPSPRSISCTCATRCPPGRGTRKSSFGFEGTSSRPCPMVLMRRCASRLEKLRQRLVPSSTRWDRCAGFGIQEALLARDDDPTVEARRQQVLVIAGKRVAAADALLGVAQDDVETSVTPLVNALKALFGDSFVPMPEVAFATSDER